MIQTAKSQNNRFRIYSDKQFFIRDKDDPETFYIEVLDVKNAASDFVETDVKIPKGKLINPDPYFD